MPSTVASLSNFEEGIDRKQLRLALARFRAISTARLGRVRAMLTDRQRQFIDLLPLLLHANHPALPGYVSQQAPCGISGFTPSAEVLSLARRVALSFSYQRPAASEAQVHGVYLMGSSGTLGHSDGSDLDVWICYPEQLEGKRLALLQKKATQLQLWALESGLEAHLFLMNGEKFKRGQREPLTGENCGSAQHYLLLDEFYRTGILLAGRWPAWWLVPPAAEAHYAQFCHRLTQKRYFKSADLVDFGGIASIPQGEFVGAGIWQLYKAIDSPFKSVLKLLLFEVYAAQVPLSESLSADYKRAVYHGVVDIDELDPYMMIYRRLEHHLLRREEPERLEIVRRCLYYKAGTKLSRPALHGSDSWQRSLMVRLTGEWGWDAHKLAKLDSHPDWNIHEVSAERNELVRELTCSYRFLAEFARQSEAGAAIDAHEFSILGRKLYAAYERKAGKIEAVNPGRARNVAEQELSVCTRAMQARDSVDSPWIVQPGVITPLATPGTNVLKQSACLTELLAWCVLNGVMAKHTRLSTREALDGLRHSELRRMVADLRELVHARTSPERLDDEAFAKAAQPLELLAFVNVATDPLRHLREQGVQRVTNRTDSLDFSSLRDNLVLNIETVLCNSWGEIVATRYTRDDGLIRCLRDYLQPLTAGTVRPHITIRCYCASRAAAIATRVEELFRDLGQCFDITGIRDARYVLAIANRLHLVQLHDGVVSSRSAAGLEELYALLGQARAAWCALTIDRHALHGSALQAICRHLVAGHVTVFCENNDDALQITVVDEQGSFFHAHYHNVREERTLCAFDQFLAAVRYRQNSAVLPNPAASDALPGAQFYRLSRGASNGEYGVQRLMLPANKPGPPFLSLQAIGETGQGETPCYTVYCNGIGFSQHELGEAFPGRLAAYVHALRGAGGQYPIHLTDIDLSALADNAAQRLQTVHYLQHKQLLETQIEQALRASPA
ncbi:MAG: class I adenylate cyclase [Pseudomonadales bacterium]|nr:class I adenylate cyclase [Pseudomonadales bacterium]